jgi:hypothetical protein
MEITDQMYETNEMPTRYAYKFMREFDRLVGTDREINQVDTFNSYVFCYEMTNNEISICRDIENALGCNQKKVPKTVRLDNGTVGTINAQHSTAILGEIVNVHLHDENGNPLEREGRLVEILEEHERRPKNESHAEFQG